MRALAEEELARIKAALPEAEHAMRLALLPRDAADERSAILEIRAGTGGEEAALFAADLAQMYRGSPRGGAGAGRWSRRHRPSSAATRSSSPMSAGRGCSRR